MQSQREVDEDIQAADSPLIVKAAAAVQGFSGLFVMLNGLQLLGATFRTEILDFGPWAQVVFGLAQLGMAAMQFRARVYAGVGSIVLGAVVALMMVIWFFFLATSIVSCVMYAAVPLSLLNLLLSVAAIMPLLRTARARQRLADQGMGLGL